MPTKYELLNARRILNPEGRRGSLPVAAMRPEGVQKLRPGSMCTTQKELDGAKAVLKEGIEQFGGDEKALYETLGSLERYLTAQARAYINTIPEEE